MNIDVQKMFLCCVGLLVSIVAVFHTSISAVCPDSVCITYNPCSPAETSCIGRIINRALEQNKCSLAAELLAGRSEEEQRALWPCVLTHRSCAAAVLRVAWFQANAYQKQGIVAGLCASAPGDVMHVIGKLSCDCFLVAQDIIVEMVQHPNCNATGSAVVAFMTSCPSDESLCLVLQAVVQLGANHFKTFICELLQQLVCLPYIGQRGAVELLTRLFNGVCFERVGCELLSALALCDIPHKAEIIGEIISSVIEAPRAAELLCCLIFVNYMKGTYSLSDLTTTMCTFLSSCRADRCSILVQAYGVDLSGSLCSYPGLVSSTECSYVRDPLDWVAQLASMTDELASCLCEFANNGPQGVESAAIMLCKIITCNNENPLGIGTSQATQILIRMITIYGPECGVNVLEQLRTQFYGLPCGDLYTDIIKVEVLVQCQPCNPCDAFFASLGYDTYGLCDLLKRALSTRCIGENAVIAWLTEVLVHQQDWAFQIIHQLCMDCPEYMCLVTRAFANMPQENFEGAIQALIEFFVPETSLCAQGCASGVTSGGLCVVPIIVWLVVHNYEVQVLNTLARLMQSQRVLQVANLLCCMAISNTVCCCGPQGALVFEKIVAGLALYGPLCTPVEPHNDLIVTRADYVGLITQLCVCPESAPLIARAFGIIDQMKFSEPCDIRCTIKGALIDIMRSVVQSNHPCGACCSWLRSLLEEFAVIVYGHAVDMTIVECLCEQRNVVSLKCLIEHLVDCTLPLKGQTTILVKDGQDCAKYKISVGFKKCGNKVFLSLDPAIYLHAGAMEHTQGFASCPPCQADGCPRMSIQPGVLSAQVLSGNLRKCLLKNNPYVAGKSCGSGSLEDCLEAIGEEKAWRLFEDLRRKFE